MRHIALKSIEYFLSLPYRMEIVEDKEEGGHVVSFPDLKGCISTGDTLEHAVANAKDAQLEWFIAALEDGYMEKEFHC